MCLCCHMNKCARIAKRHLMTKLQNRRKIAPFELQTMANNEKPTPKVLCLLATVTIDWCFLFLSPHPHLECVCAVFVACHFGIKSTYCYIYHPRSVLFTHRRLSSLFWYFLVWQTIHNRFPCQNPCHFPSLFLLSHTLLLSLSKNGASNFSQTLSIRKSSPRSPLFPKHSEYSSNWSK